MTQPTVHPFTTSVYERLPLTYRDQDTKQGWALLRWLSLLSDQLGAVTDVADRIEAITADEYQPVQFTAGDEYSGDYGDFYGGLLPVEKLSALTDPDLADARWLPWLAQFIGEQVSSVNAGGYGSGFYGGGPYGGGGLTSDHITDLRLAIHQHLFARGSRKALETITRRYLTPGAAVTIHERVGDRWHYTVEVASADVIDEAAMAAALANENPAGMVLTVNVT